MPCNMYLLLVKKNADTDSITMILSYINFKKCYILAKI